MATPEQIKANKANAKKSPHKGRPVSDATLKAQLQRKMLTTWLEPELTEIFTALAKKAKEGDVPAAKELFDRAWGKPVQPLNHGDNEGNKIVFMPTEIANKHDINSSTS